MIEITEVLVFGCLFLLTGKEIRYECNRCAVTFGFLQHAA